MSVNLVSAAEATPQPGTPEDNECNVGGVLYREDNQDGCPTLWYWKAGWFLARFNQGLLSRADFPVEFESVLPPLNEKNTLNSNCWAAVGNISSILYNGVPNTLNNVLGFAGADCDPNYPLALTPGSTVVFAPDFNSAQTICQSLGVSGTLFDMMTFYPTAPADAWGCTY